MKVVNTTLLPVQMARGTVVSHPPTLTTQAPSTKARAEGARQGGWREEATSNAAGVSET